MPFYRKYRLLVSTSFSSGFGTERNQDQIYYSSKHILVLGTDIDYLLKRIGAGTDQNQLDK